MVVFIDGGTPKDLCTMFGDAVLEFENMLKTCTRSLPALEYLRPPMFEHSAFRNTPFEFFRAQEFITFSIDDDDVIILR